eukprot:281132-Chlamydomonas_euryale.AAC.6
MEHAPCVGHRLRLQPCGPSTEPALAVGQEGRVLVQFASPATVQHGQPLVPGRHLQLFDDSDFLLIGQHVPANKCAAQHKASASRRAVRYVLVPHFHIVQRTRENQPPRAWSIAPTAQERPPRNANVLHAAAAMTAPT